MAILIYDYEVFKHNTLLGILNTDTDAVIQLWDIQKIRSFIRENLDNIWVRL